MRNLLRGFTVIEALFTMGLILLVLGVLGGLFDSYRRLSVTGQQDQGSSLSAILTGDVVRRDASCAISFSIPDSATLELKMVDRWNPNRLPVPVPATPDLTWMPHRSDFMMNVTYTLSGEKLRRNVRFSDGSTFNEDVTDGIKGLTFGSPAANMISTRVSFELQGVIKTWESTCILLLPGNVYP